MTRVIERLKAIVERKKPGQTWDYFISSENIQDEIQSVKFRNEHIYEVVHRIRNSLTVRPKCKNPKCDSDVEFNDWKGGYLVYCSDVCKNTKHTAYYNLFIRFPDLTFEFSAEYFYSNKELPVRCNKCSSRWNMLRSTAISHSVCRTCTPFNKHKTQNEVCNFVRELDPDGTVKQNDRVLIHPKEVDIIHVESGLCIEYNGLLPHSSGDSKLPYYNSRTEKINYHLNKTLLVEKLGKTLLHVFEHEWADLRKRAIWKSIISGHLGKHEIVHSQECVIVQIHEDVSNGFFNSNHLNNEQFTKMKPAVSYGLMFRDDLLSVCSFFDNNEHYRVQYCDRKNVTVVDAFETLQREFCENHSFNSLMFECSRTMGNFNIHGFKKTYTFPQSYFFAPGVNKLFSYKRTNAKELNNYDESLTLTENMYNHGFRKIYDCGNVVFTLGDTENTQHSQLVQTETFNNIVESYEPKKHYRGLNRRLLMYELNGFDYSKRRNKSYCDRFYTRLLLNWYWMTTKDVKRTLLFCIQRKVNLVKTTKQLGLEFDFETTKNNIMMFLSNSECKQCNAELPLNDRNRQFCSNMCSARHKATDVEYLTKLKSSATRYYARVSADVLKKRHVKIKNTIISLHKQ